MAVQVDKTLLAFFLPEDFKFKEEDKVLTVADLAYNSSEIHVEYLRKQEECLIYVADMCVFFWGCFNFCYELSAPHTAEIFNAIFNILARSAQVVREIKSCSFTACFYLTDQSGVEDSHKSSINGIWSLMTHFFTSGLLYDRPKKIYLLSVNGRFLTVQVSKRIFFCFCFFPFSTAF